MKTLALDTSLQPGALALLDDDGIRYEAPLPRQQRTTESFAVQIRNALEHSDWRPADIELFAVCEGPGSFTGLRIGVTAAKTFAYATGCQLAAVNTLAVLARQAADTSVPVWAVLDAQRQQLFVAQYQRDGGRMCEVTATHLVDARDWIARLPQGARVTGTGLRNWLSTIPDHVDIVSEQLWEVQAGHLGGLALQSLADGQTTDAWKLTPQYYRPSAAEEKLRK